MTKFAIAKLAINLIAGAGVAKVTNDFINNNVDIDGIDDRIKVAIGSVVFGSMVSQAASTHLNGRIDSLVSLWQNRKTAQPFVEMAEDFNGTAA